MIHLEESGNEPFAPLNSSLQMSTKPAGGVGACGDLPQYTLANRSTTSPQGQLDAFLLMAFSPSEQTTLFSGSFYLFERKWSCRGVNLIFV